MSEIPKAYEPQAVEARWYRYWLDQHCFVADPARVSDKRPAYSIVIPPPNVTGMLHMGHVLNNTIQDILSRKARMDGKEVLWLPGTDHAGIATEGMVAKQLKKEEKKSKQDIGREVLSKLKDTDEIAFVRFASVYREFQNVEDFERVIRELERTEVVGGRG